MMYSLVWAIRQSIVVLLLPAWVPSCHVVQQMEGCGPDLLAQLVQLQTPGTQIATKKSSAANFVLNKYINKHEVIDENAYFWYR